MMRLIYDRSTKKKLKTQVQSSGFHTFSPEYNHLCDDKHPHITKKDSLIKK